MYISYIFEFKLLALLGEIMTDQPANRPTETDMRIIGKLHLCVCIKMQRKPFLNVVLAWENNVHKPRIHIIYVIIYVMIYIILL